MRKLKLEELGRMDAAAYAERPKRPIVLVADNVRSMHNIGAFFRTADALAIQEIILCGISAQPPHRDIHKTALGAELTVAWTYEQDVAVAVAQLKAKGYTILGLEQTDNSTVLASYVPQGPLALVAGHEVKGMSESILPLLDQALEIPQYGTKHSLNVSVATGIALYQLSSYYPL